MSRLSGLGDSWPACVRLRHYAEDNMKTLSALKCYSEVIDVAGYTDEGRGGFRTCWRDPNSAFHLLWSILGLLILFADSTVTPYALAWEAHMLDDFGVFTYMSLGYWALDIALRFSTGFYKDGALITSRLDIARRYIRTSCPPDVFFVALESLSVAFLTVGGPGVNDMHTHMSQLGQAIKLLLLLRIFRCAWIFERLTERILSERARMVFAFSSIVALMLWGIHVVACLWWFIGRKVGTHETRHWTDGFDRAHTKFDQYIVAYHWTIAQATLGAIDVVCTNSLERMFNIACLALGLMVGSSMISAFSASLVELQMANKDRNMKMRTLRRYLREHEVRPTLSLAIQHQVTERLQERKELVESQVMAVELLSSSLRSALRVEVARKTLLSHSLFVQLSALDGTWCFTFCQDGFEIIALSAQDDMFFTSDMSKAAYVLVKGSASYANEMRCQEMPIGSQEPEVVESGVWLAEATLWSEWLHVGKAVAVTPAQVFQVSPGGLHRSTRSFPNICQVAREYGKQFHRRIICAGSHSLAYPTDLSVPYTDWEDMVLSMNSEVQRIISLAAVSRLDRMNRASSVRSSMTAHRGAGGTSSARHLELQDEVVAGKSIVVVNSKGQPERIVSVVVAHVTREDGRYLVQVGKHEAKGSTPACELPGLKRESSELVGDAWCRLRTTKLGPLAEVIQVQRSERLTSKKSSKQHGVQSKYLRHVLYCSLTGGFDAPSCTALTPFDGGSWATGMGDTMTLSASGNATPRPGRPPPEVLQKMLGDFANKEVFFFRYGGKGAFFAWLSQREFDLLGSLGGEKLGSMWLAALGQPSPEPP